MGRGLGGQAGLSHIPTASIERLAPETTEAREAPSQHLCSPPAGGAGTEASEGQPRTDVLGTRAATTRTGRHLRGRGRGSGVLTPGRTTLHVHSQRLCSLSPEKPQEARRGPSEHFAGWGGVSGISPKD